mmetsp:Transcript_1274/g.3461  ORF Transcript_1274/g.3461 Transcript_1274/m.3461 type:complete len:107 (-) Transcript_1274:771-1091(-)
MGKPIMPLPLLLSEWQSVYERNQQKCSTEGIIDERKHAVFMKKLALGITDDKAEMCQRNTQCLLYSPTPTDVEKGKSCRTCLMGHAKENTRACVKRERARNKLNEP